MQSKIGQLKIMPNAKSNTLQSYRQHHASQQQHAANSIRKVRKILLNYNITVKTDFS